MLDLRFRFVIRRSFLSIVDSAQTVGNEHFRVIAPAFSTLINAAYGRLQSRWDLVIKRREEVAKTESGEDLTSQEVYLEDVTCLLTREVILLLRRALFSGHASTQQATNADDSVDTCGGDEEDGIEDVAMENGSSHSQKSQGARGTEGQTMSEFGEFLCDPTVIIFILFI